MSPLDSAFKMMIKIQQTINWAAVQVHQGMSQAVVPTLEKLMNAEQKRKAGKTGTSAKYV